MFYFDTDLRHTDELQLSNTRACGLLILDSEL